MVRIYSDGNGDFVIQTTATDTDAFICELSEAMSSVIVSANDYGMSCMGIMKQAMPIAFKLSGYKADTVQEQRTLVCGSISPQACQEIAHAGR
jgi:hypothetical protein